MNLGWNFIPYISAIQGMELIHVTLQKFLNLMGWNFILQGDEILGMISIQDEGMDFQPSNIWIFHQDFNKIWGGIFCHKGVDYRVCFSAWDRTEISYHYEVLLVGKFLPLKVELTVYISCPKEDFFQCISQILFHTTAGWISIYALCKK
jgi:hypothetical protein